MAQHPTYPLSPFPAETPQSNSSSQTTFNEHQFVTDLLHQWTQVFQSITQGHMGKLSSSNIDCMQRIKSHLELLLNATASIAPHAYYELAVLNATLAAQLNALHISNTLFEAFQTTVKTRINNPNANHHNTTAIAGAPSSNPVTAGLFDLIGAQHVKGEIKQIFIPKTTSDKLVMFFSTGTSPRSYARDPFHNPIAHTFTNSANPKKIVLSSASQSIINASRNSAKLCMTATNQVILKNYYTDRKKMTDPLGILYQSISFEDFILRLYNNRFKEVYFDGRALVPRSPHDFDKSKEAHDDSTKNNRALLEKIGTIDDHDALYKKYLTLEETVLSTLIIPQVTAIVIGTGSRTEESTWNVIQEFNQSIDTAVFSYPAAAEFRDGRTLHYDLLFIAKPENPTAEYFTQIEKIKNNPALMTAAKSIYGELLIFEKEINNKDFVHMPKTNWYIYKSAYLNRTKNMLTNLLLSADYEMNEKKLGPVYQLKGLGLGAFAFASGNSILEYLYVEALKETLMTIAMQFSAIKIINLINFPSSFIGKRKKDTQSNNFSVTCMAVLQGIQVIKTIMDPSTQEYAKIIGDIGGITVCGDSGSAFGNEGNIGLDRHSSDDPASQYSILDPCILNAACNPTLQNDKCIMVIADTQQRTLSGWNFELSKGSKANHVYVKFTDHAQAELFTKTYTIPSLFDETLGKSLPQPDGARVPGYWIVRIPYALKDSPTYYEDFRKAHPQLQLPLHAWLAPEQAFQPLIATLMSATPSSTFTSPSSTSSTSSTSSAGILAISEHATALTTSATPPLPQEVEQTHQSTAATAVAAEPESIITPTIGGQ